MYIVATNRGYLTGTHVCNVHCTIIKNALVGLLLPHTPINLLTESKNDKTWYMHMGWMDGVHKVSCLSMLVGLTEKKGRKGSGMHA